MDRLAEDLIAARALIDTPEKWRKDDNGSATSCCAVVAVNRAYGGPYETGWTALRLAIPPMWEYANIKRINREEDINVLSYPGVLVGYYNDDPATTHADIMALFDRAVASARQSTSMEGGEG